MNNPPLRSYVFALLISAFFSHCSPSSRSATEVLPTKSSWRKLGPGGGGSTFLPVFAWSDPDRFAVRCDMTGTYLTDDGGTSYWQVNFPNGTSAYAYDPADSNTLYIGASALHRSQDGGRTFKLLFPKKEDVIDTVYHGDHASFRMITSDRLYGEDARRINTLRVDPADGSALYFSMGNYFYYTKDGGQSWKKEDLGFPIRYLYTNASSLENELYIFTAGPLYRFDKRNQAFKKEALPAELSSAFSFTGGTLRGTDEVVFYALQNAPDDDNEDEFGSTTVWISRDGAMTWASAGDRTILNTASGISPSYSMIACAEHDAAQVYVVCNRYLEKKSDGSKVYWYGALKSGDRGVSWNWVWKGGGGSGQYGVKDGVGVANLEDAWAESAFGGEYIRLLDAGVYPRDGNVAVVTDWYRSMKTVDGGQTWNEVYSVRQPDGSFTSRGMDVTTAYGVHTDPFDPEHIAISYTDIGYHHSYNGGKSWFRSVQGVPAEWVNTCYWIVFDPEVKGKVWSVWSNLHDFPRGKMTRSPNWKQRGKGGVCVSTDGGRSWVPSNEGMGFDSPATSIVLDPGSPPGRRTLYASVYSKGVFKSTDDGRTWTLKNRGIEENTAAFELTIDKEGNLFLVVSPTPMHRDGRAGTGFHSGTVYKSVDGAENWKMLKVSDGLLFPSGIEIDPDNPERIYLACWADITLSDLVGGNVVRASGEENVTLEMPGGIFLSEDGGDTWRSIFDQQQYVYDVTVDPRHPGRLYCNTFNQMAWRSDDHGKSWKRLKDYDFHWGHRVITDPYDRENVYLTTYGSSVWYGAPVTAD